MSTDTGPNEARRHYAAAHAAHYTDGDLPLALQLYKKLVESYPNSPEAGYAQTQVHNIANAVVPKRELLDAQVEMALARLASRTG